MGWDGRTTRPPTTRTYAPTSQDSAPAPIPQGQVAVDHDALHRWLPPALASRRRSDKVLPKELDLGVELIEHHGFTELDLASPRPRLLQK